MKLEFLDDISYGGQFKDVIVNQLVRLYEFDKFQASKFRTAVQLTVIDNCESLNLTKLDFIEIINCNLTMCISDFDIGITTIDKINFFCYLNTAGYKEMVSLIESFCNEARLGSYQWLYNIDTPIEFLFSVNGSW